MLVEQGIGIGTMRMGDGGALFRIDVEFFLLSSTVSLLALLKLHIRFSSVRVYFCDSVESGSRVRCTHVDFRLPPNVGHRSHRETTNWRRRKRKRRKENCWFNGKSIFDGYLRKMYVHSLRSLQSHAHMTFICGGIVWTACVAVGLSRRSVYTRLWLRGTHAFHIHIWIFGWCVAYGTRTRTRTYVYIFDNNNIYHIWYPIPRVHSAHIDTCASVERTLLLSHTIITK